jgi:gluconolactonase
MPILYGMLFAVLAICLFAPSCMPKKAQESKKESIGIYRQTGSFEVKDPAFTDLIDTAAGIDILASGLDWSEGPLWVEKGGYLLFSDIPPNKIMKWSEAKGLELYLQPSGYTGTVPRAGEPGSNGLLLDKNGNLVLCQHGDRRIARMDAPLDRPAPKFITLADRYEGKRLNSPNDAVCHSNGDLYFTDPPYGLIGNMSDSSKEIAYQGVYRLHKDGTVDLLTKEIARPNGIALSPDEKKLYVANSHSNRIWMVYNLAEDGTLSGGKIFYDATASKEWGAPDGMKVHPNGMIFATGPGGAWVMTPEGKALGRIRIQQACSNLAFDSRKKNLFITADSLVLRVRLK